MATKITLSVDQQVADSAKAFAQRNGKTLSGLVEDYLRTLTISDNVKAMMGVIKLTDDFDYKLAIGDAMTKKVKLL